MDFQVMRIPLIDRFSGLYQFALFLGHWIIVSHSLLRVTHDTVRKEEGGVDGEVLTALIAAAAAVSGGAVTGWFTLAAAKRQAHAAVNAAQRQADAAWASGRRQADAAWEAGRQQASAAWEAGQVQAAAQLDVARQTLREQALAAQRNARRTAYVTFLGRIDAAHKARKDWQKAVGTADGPSRRTDYETALFAVPEALYIVRLEGPESVTTAADALEVTLQPAAPDNAFSTAHAAFLTTARAALAAPL
ncbi:hypothetical protein ACWGJT_34640 [Streptomyces xantholiticus]